MLQDNVKVASRADVCQGTDYSGFGPVSQVMQVMSLLCALLGGMGCTKQMITIVSALSVDSLFFTPSKER